ncbi:hypothetical protein NLJ89_g8521 [Agrocybe chaxingu]|uniref:Uncharacterized protein n=1 Tax=Agrocybe chaxingu TaxID=84603 RepID=A0A9W8JV63_9AGAR|nr:hypothetical protein NLJ89_g8521 [Agrocybe chaxingu]
MPRENSFSDSEGRSVTPDPEDEDFIISPASPNYSQRPPVINVLDRVKSRTSKRSMHSKVSRAHPSAATGPTRGWALLPPKEKFRAAVRKIMAIRRGTTFNSLGARIGAEPGVDPRRSSADATYGHIHRHCEIEIVDYSALRCITRKFTNEEFVDLMDQDSPEPVKRDPWVKVRWINIGGISWDVIKALAIKYDLHPLALEDVVKGNPRTRSKADYYTQHLFLRVLCHQLAEGEQNPGITGPERTTSPEPLEDEYDTPSPTEEKVDDERTQLGSSTSLRRRKNPVLPTSQKDVKFSSMSSAESPNSLAKLLMRESAAKAARETRQKEEASLKAVKHGERVEVDVSSMFLFLFRDGTVISLHPSTSLTFTAPISQRLRALDTVLRKSADPSLLIHAILDLIVDRALQVIDQYHANINQYEHDILLRPKMKTVRRLHILSGDLILHKRTLEPIKTLVYGLRRYDVDRCAALVDSSDPANAGVPIVGFMSHKSKIYLADVYDHMEYILSSLDMFAGIAENLIGYTFNIASYEMNEVMRRLTLATIIFLPMTVLTGYFGMNFVHFWSVNNNSDVFFWILALPILTLTVLVALFSDIKKLFYYLKKRAETKKIMNDSPFSRKF